MNSHSTKQVMKYPGRWGICTRKSHPPNVIYKGHLSARTKTVDFKEKVQSVLQQRLGMRNEEEVLVAADMPMRVL